MKSFVVVAAVLAMLACETVGEAGTCPLPEVTAAQFLGLSVAQFDQDSQAGWRAVADFEARFKRPGPVWPMNLDVVDRLGACFDSVYREAYAGTCQAEASPSTSATAHRP